MTAPISSHRDTKSAQKTSASVESTVVSALRDRLAIDGERVAYRFLSYQPDQIVETITFSELDRRAQVVAARLQAAGAAGERVLLIAEPGIDFVTSLFGCLYAGAVAAPAYPPDAISMGQTIPRLLTMVEDAQAKYMIATNVSEHPLRSHFGEQAFDAAQIGQGDAPAGGIDWAPHDAAELALLQYTSGSTGVPRGVMITHSGLMANIAGICELLDVENAKMLHWLPPYHDMGLIGGIFSPVVAGREVISMSPFSFIQRPLRWLQAIHEYRATTTASPNFGFEVCLRKVKPADCANLDLSSLQIVISGAERIRMSTMNQFFERFASIGADPSAFRPSYGLAESTLLVTAIPHGGRVRTTEAPSSAEQSKPPGENGAALEGVPLEIDSNHELVSCGVPFKLSEVLIVDPQSRRPVPEGAVGEVWVNSPSNGIGYWRKEEATRDTFQATLADDPQGAQYLRTGDLGFVDRGELFVTGRLKELVIVAGRKYFPQDLEMAAASAHDALKIDSSAAFSVDDGGHERLVMVHEVSRPKRFDLNEITLAIRQAIREQYAISPDNVVLVESGMLPKTTSGKLQRTATRTMFLEDKLAPLNQWATPEVNPGDRTGTPPDTEVEKRLADIWREVLDLDVVFQEDDFFALGGHSLTAMQMAVRIEQQFSVKLPIRDVFTSPTVRQMADTIEAKRAAGELAELQRSRPDGAEPTRSGEETQQIPLLPERDGTPLSFSEQRMWFSERLEPANPFYNLPLAARVSGEFDQQAVTQALLGLVERHESLRTTYHLQDGEPCRKIHAPGELDVAPQFIDLRNKPSDQLWQQVYEESRRPFDLEAGPLLRYTVFQLADREHVVLLVLHHIIADGWSMGVMLSEFAEFYRAHTANQPPMLEPLKLQYADFAQWQRDQLSDDRLSELMDYWRRQLEGAPSVIELPLDRQRPAVQDFEGSQLTFALSPQVSLQIKRNCLAAHTTPFAFLLSAYFCLLSRLSGQRDICVGTAAASRTTQALESLIGFFVNTLVIRAKLDDDPSFEKLLQQVADTALEAQAHGELPFEKLVERFAASRDRSHSPIFQAAFVYQRPLGELPAAAGLSIEPLRVDNGTAKHDLTFEFDDVGDRFVLTVHYRSALFDRESIERFAKSFQAICESAIEAPSRSVSRLTALDPSQRERVINDLNATDCEYSGPHTIHELIESHAQASPDAVAIQFGGRQVSYGELSAWSDQIARNLAVRGVAPGTHVLTWLPRSADLEAVMLGVFKAGGRYVPLDVTQPLARSLAIIQQCSSIAHGNLLVIVPDDDAVREQLAEFGHQATLVALSALLEARGDRSAQLPSVSPDDVAYVIFTSGSTGAPKGVMVPHRAISNFARAHAQRLGVSRNDRVLHALSPAFDGGLSESILALASGATSVVAGDDCRDPKRLAEFLREERVTVAKFTPGLLTFVDDTNLPDLRVISTGGDTLTGELAERWIAAGKRFFNGYGPTEATVGVTMHEVKSPAPARPPLGVPMANMRVYVLDEHRQPQPVGVAGEIYIGGAGVADGYLGDPDLTQAKFVDDPFDKRPGARMYASGDLGRWNAGGELEFLGRKDRQVKIRGYRVEPDEIARQLTQLNAVADAAVTTSPGGQLVAYVVMQADGQELHAKDHVENWLSLFTESRRAAPVALDAEFDISGWMNSYTGRPLGADAMREWLGTAVQNVLAASPRRVLEIGCGTGMILFRVAPQVEHYTGTDMFASSLAQVEGVVERRDDLKDRVRLLHRAADDFSGLEGERFDTVVLNSVVQYFPNVEYLLGVLDQAVQHLTPGGCVVIGDVRSKPHSEALATGIELANSDPSSSGQRIAQRVAARVAREEELLVDPELFYALSQRYETLSDVVVKLKDGQDHNELTRYRYEVLLRFGDSADHGASRPHPMPRVVVKGKAELEKRLRGLQEATCFEGLSNARIAEEVAAWRFVSTHPHAELGDRSPDTEAASVVDPNEIKQLVASLGVEAWTTWDADFPERLKVIAWPRGAAAPRGLDAWSADQRRTPCAWSQWCNNPLEFQQSVELTRTLRTEFRKRAPDYMTPSSFIVVDAIPQTASGKVDFAALPAPSATLARSSSTLVPPENETEEKLVAIWESLLGVSPIGALDDFFELGGHSMLAVRLMAQIEDQFQREVPLAALFQEATIRRLATLIDDPDAGAAVGSLVALQPTGDAAPLFCLHPAGGTVFCYQQLAAQFVNRRPVYALQAVGIDGRDQPHTEVAAMAAHYADLVQSVNPNGPCHLTGWSLGGTLAFEVARQLKQRGAAIGSLTLIDAAALGEAHEFEEDDFENMIAAMFPAADRVPLSALREMPQEQQLAYFIGLAAQAGLAPAGDVDAARHVYEVFRANVKALHEFRPQPYDGSVVLIRPRDQQAAHELTDDPTQGWKALASSVDVQWSTGDHKSMVYAPHVQRVAEIVEECIAQAAAAG